MTKSATPTSICISNPCRMVPVVSCARTELPISHAMCHGISTYGNGAPGAHLGLHLEFSQMARHENKLSAREAQPLLELQHRWIAALVSADTGTLDTILVDSYVDTDDSGYRTGKAGILAALKLGDLKLTSIKLLETGVHK